MSTQSPQQVDQVQNQNALAHWMFDFQRKIEPHTNKILLAIILGTIGIVAFQVMSRSEAAKKSEAWSKYAACTNAEEFRDVADDHAGGEIESWARLEAARHYIRTGVQTSMTNRKASTESLENGKSQLEKVLNNATAPAEAREQALVQMAVCLESLCDGDMKPASDAYDRLIKEFPDSYYVTWAKGHLEALKRPDASEFYAWFQKAQPAPPDRPKPQDVKASDLPNIKLEGEDQPASSASGEAPSTSEATTPPATESKPAEIPATETPATETPAAGTPAPATDKPAADPVPAAPTPPPASETPSALEASPPVQTPATETPATETPAPASPDAPPAQPAPEAPQQ